MASTSLPARGADHFRLVFDASPVGMALVDLDGRWIDVNPALCTFLGHEHGQLLERDFQSVTHPEDLEADLEQVRALVAGETRGYQLRKRYVRPDGTAVWALLSVSLVRDDDGEPTYFVVQVVDVDAQVRAEAALENRTKLFTLSFESTLLAQVVGDERGVLLEVNQAFCDLLGRSREELVGHHHDEFTHPDDVGLGTAHGSLADLDPSRPSRFEKRFLHRDGREVWVELSMTSVRTDGGEVRRLVHVDDITTARRARLLQQAENAWLQGLVQLQREATRLVGDKDAVIDLVVNRALALLEAADGASVALPVGDEDDAVLAYVSVAGSLAPGAGMQFPRDASVTGLAFTADQVVHVRDTGQDDRVSPRALELFGPGSMILAPLPTESRTLGVLTLVSTEVDAFDDRDVHLVEALAHLVAGALRLAEDHERLADAVALATERAQAIELATDAVVVRDLDDRVRYWSPSAERLYGWRAADVEGRDLDDLLGTRTHDGRTLEAVRAQLMQFGTWEGELEHQTSEGRFVTVLSRKAIQRDRTGTPVAVLTINTDITARRRAEAALAASEELFRSQYEHSAVGLCIRGADDILESVNPALVTMLGYRHPHELIGTSARGLASEDVREARGSALVAIYAGETDSVSFETKLLRRDGSELDVHFTTSALRNDEGRPVRFVSIFQDISERKAAERARDAAMAELEEHNHRLAAADQLKTDLIGMLGHEINNPLSVLSGALDAFEMAQTEESAWTAGSGCTCASSRPGALPRSALPGLLPMMRRGVTRIGDTVREILTMVTADADRLTARREPVVVGVALAELLVVLDRRIPLEGDLEAVALVQGQHLEQIAANLASNADKYAAGLSRIHVDDDGALVRITFEDRGPGISEHFVERLFERFSRDEESVGETRGTGLGLHICRELARANGGDLVHRSAAPHGAAFTLVLQAPERVGSDAPR